MNIQDWFPLGLTGLISMQPKGLSRVFSNTTVQKHQFFGAWLSLRSNSHILTWPLEKLELWLDGPLLAEECLCFLICSLVCHTFSSKEQPSFNFMTAVTLSQFQEQLPQDVNLAMLFSGRIYILFYSCALVAQMVKHLPTMWETWVQSLSGVDLLEMEMATHSSILAWKIPWMEEPGRLQCMGSQRVGHNWATSLTHSLKALSRYILKSN